MPAALWAGARDSGRKNPNPVVMTATVSKTSSNQLWTRLLCSACEERFNNNGERYVLSWIKPKGIADGEFPLLDRVEACTTDSRPSTLNAYAGDRIELRSLATRRPLRFCFSARRAALVNFNPGNFCRHRFPSSTLCF
jgi:hypothetical protein